MEIKVRYAVPSDSMAVVCGLRNKNFAYNTTAQAKADITNHQLLVAEINGKVVGSLAIIPTSHGYMGLKRGCVYNKKYKGKGIMTALFDYAVALNLGSYGCTPWAENIAIIKILLNHNFKYQKTVHENYMVYVRA